MTIISAILGIIFALMAVGALGLIALFFACDRAALYEESKRNNENKAHH
jgi:hypothetical protein